MDADHPYIYRGLRATLDDALSDTRVVCLLGPRQSGKSTLSRSLAPDRHYETLDDPDILKIARDDPNGYIRSLPEFVTIDEIQRAPDLILSIKLEVDKNPRPGRFLLTGSSNLTALPRIKDSLAGRIETLKLFPFTESEKEQTPGGLTQAMLEGTLDTETGDLTTFDPNALRDRLLVGGYPEAISRPVQRVGRWHRSYLTSIIERDIHDVENVRDTDDILNLLELLSHRSGTLLNVANLTKETGKVRSTVEKYLSVLERLFLIRRTRAWHNSESKRLIMSPKLHFVDSGLACSLSRLSAADWTRDRTRFGRILESFVVQQISAQAQWFDPDLRIYHYRDKDQEEVDVVITRGKDVWGIEVKLGSTLATQSALGLRRLEKLCGKNFKGGFILYNGPHTIPFHADPQFLAVPIQKFWTT